ncbi:MAG: polyprenyl synthetase family protein [Acidobacteria bacterium]|nr:polyprenyl synthetase family protein [Acidobacteriota bacterium]
MTASSNAPEDGGGRAEAETVPDQFPAFVAANRPRIEGALREHLPTSDAPGTGRFNEALRCAVFPGGKRLRPLLSLAGSRLGGAADEQALALACAVEFIHTSSLILDDLPGMDDAGVRRGQSALHIAFGEGVAVLVAVALLNQSYALLAASARDGAQAARVPRLVGEAAGCVGHAGMIAGQAAELALSGARADDSTAGDAILPTRMLKTTALLRLVMIGGAIISGAPDEETDALAAFGECLGRAYQIYDDLADTLDDQRATGKSVGQDLRHLRPTLVRGLSPAEVRKLAAGVVESGKEALARFGERPAARLLRSAADHIVAGFNPADSSSETAA